MIRRFATLSLAMALGCGDEPRPTAPSALSSRAGGVGPAGICRDEDGNPLPTAPRSARVDLAKPAFSHPLTVTNPLFPVSSLHRVILLGSVDGVPLRVETTLLSTTKSIDLRGNRVIETLVSQYIAWLDGRILEVALDFYAQGDEGATWYAGEDVFNYQGGVVVDTDGTWLAGEDGPIAMIMPAAPRVGNVWRPENICGLVFEEVTATQTGLTISGPRGPVHGALRVTELHQDGQLEDKIFAPGYGEFFTGSGGNVEAVALALPIDALPGPVPVDLQTLKVSAIAVHNAADAGAWAAAAASLASMNAAWIAFKAGNVPPRLESQMDLALAALTTAVGAQQEHAARQAAIRVEQASLDLQLRHRPVREIDLALLDLWARQLSLDQDEGDQPGVLSDQATILWIQDRLP